MSTRLAPDYVFAALVFGLTLFGLIMLASASGPKGYQEFGDAWYFVKHQFLFGVVPGMMGAVCARFIPLSLFKRVSLLLLPVSILLLVTVFLPGLAADFGTSHSWVSLGGLFSFQPAELVKLTLILYFSAWFASRKREQIRDFSQGFIPFVSVLGVVLLLLILQPDIGSLVIIAATSLALFLAAGAAPLHLGGLLVSGVLGLFVLIQAAPYRAARFMTFLYPDRDPQGVGYHIHQALLAVGSGGLWGLGYGQSRQKFQYLPEVAGDSLFAVIAEEMGFFVCLALIAAFFLLFWRTTQIARTTKDRFSAFLVIGIGSWIAIQAAVNIGSMLGLMPMTGVTLPFMSYGGSSVAILLTAAGLVMNVSAHRT